MAASEAVPGVESAKRAASVLAVDTYVRSGMVVGVGSGSTVVYAIHRLSERTKLAEGDALRLTSMVFVPTSFQSRQLLSEAGLRVAELATVEAIDVAIDGADEVDPALNCIKGGGGCQLEEKLVASSALKFVIIADHRKQADSLGTKWTKGIPLEVAPSAYRLVCKLVERMGGTPTLRMASRKAGPVVTDGGHFVVDAEFGAVADPIALDAKLQAVPGILETGLFCRMASHAYFGQADGTVQEWKQEGNKTIAAEEA